VHFGITMMFLGFLGQAWGVNRETTLKPGSSVTVDRYTIRFDAPRNEVDPNKRQLYADLTVFAAGTNKELGKLSPAKFSYKKNPDMPTTEVSVLHSVRDDLYVVLGSLSGDNSASLQVHINPLVSWIWVGVLLLIFGATISLWPEIPIGQLSPWARLRVATSAIVALSLSLLLASMPARAFGPLSRSSLSVVLPSRSPPCDNSQPQRSPSSGTSSLCISHAQ
jgi:cytochrome c-type biogenesis protein CcmF